MVHGGPRGDRAAFGTALYIERRQSSLRELDQRLGLEADLANRWLSGSYSVLGRIVTTAGGRPALDPGISAYLEAMRDYLIVTDTPGRVLALSEDTRQLSADAARAADRAAGLPPLTQHSGSHRPRPPGRAGPLPGRPGGVGRTGDRRSAGGDPGE